MRWGDTGVSSRGEHLDPGVEFALFGGGGCDVHDSIAHLVSPYSSVRFS